MGSGASKAAKFSFINDRHTYNARRLEYDNIRAAHKIRDLGTQGRREREVLEQALEAYSEVTDVDNTGMLTAAVGTVEVVTEETVEVGPEPSHSREEPQVPSHAAAVAERLPFRRLSSHQEKPLADRRRTVGSIDLNEVAQRRVRRASSAISLAQETNFQTRASGHANPQSLADKRKERHLRKMQQKMASRSTITSQEDTQAVFGRSSSSGAGRRTSIGRRNSSSGSQVFSTPYGNVSVHNGRAQTIMPNTRGRKQIARLQRNRSMETLLEFDAQSRRAAEPKPEPDSLNLERKRQQPSSFSATARAVSALTGTGHSVPDVDVWSFPSENVSSESLSFPRSFESRGVTVSWLLQFFEYCRKTSGNIEVSAEEVARTIIDPAIEKYGCPISYLPNVETGDPSAFVVYATDRPLREMVACLRHNFKGNLDTVVWIDLFAAERSIGALHGDVLSHMESLPSIIKSIPRVMMILDPEGSCFSTPWCLLAAYLGAQDLSSGSDGKLRILTDSIGQQQARSAGEAMAQASMVEALAEAGVPTALDGFYSCPDGDQMDEELPVLLSHAVQTLDFLPVTDPEAPGGLQIATAAMTRSSILKAAGDVEGAKILLELVLEVRVKQLGGMHMHVAAAHNSLANVLRSEGEYAKAEPHYLKALHIMETLLGLEASGLATPLFNLAELLHSQGKYEEAEPLFRRCLRLTEEGTDDETMCLAYKYMSHMKKIRGDLSGAQEMLSAALTIKEKQGRSKDGMALALLFAQGNVARAQGDHLEAAMLFKKVADAKEEQKPGSLKTGAVLHALAESYRSAGDFDSAEISYRRALAILKKHKPEDDPDVTEEMRGLMDTLRLKGEHREADLIESRIQRATGSISRRLLTVSKKRLETEDEDAERSAAVLEMVKAGKAAQAEHEQRKLLARAQSEYGPNSEPVADAALLLALILVQRKRFSEAKQLQRTALTIREAKLGSNHTDVLLVLSSLGQTMEALGESEEAEKLYHGLMGQLGSLYGPQSPEVLSIHMRHSATLMAQGKHQEALPTCEKILSLHKSRLDADDSRIPRSLDRAATAYSGAGLASEAVEHFRAALEWRETHLDANDPLIASSAARLGGALVALGKAEEAELYCQRAVESSMRSGATMRKDLALHMRCLAAVETNPGGRQKALDGAVAIENELLIEVSQQLESDLALVDESVKQGDFGSAEASCLRALSATQEALGLRHAAVIEPLRKLVDILQAQGRPGDAKVYAKDLSAAKAFQEVSEDPFSALPKIEPFDVNAGVSRAVQGGRFVDTTTFSSSQFPDGSSQPSTGSLTAKTGMSTVSMPMGNDEFEVELEALEISGNLSGAVELCMTQAERQVAAFGQGHAETGPVLSRMGELLLRQGKLPEAQAACSKAAVVIRDTAGPNSAELAASLVLMARVMRATGNDMGATLVMDQAKTINSAVAAKTEGAAAAAAAATGYISAESSITSSALGSQSYQGVIEMDPGSRRSVLSSSGSAERLPEPQESDAPGTEDLSPGQEDDPLNHSWLRKPRPPVNPPPEMTGFLHSVTEAPAPRVTVAPPPASLGPVRPPSAAIRGPTKAVEQGPVPLSNRRVTAPAYAYAPSAGSTARPPSGARRISPTGDHEADLARVRPPSAIRRVSATGHHEADLAPVRPPSAVRRVSPTGHHEVALAPVRPPSALAQRGRASDSGQRLQSYHKVSEAANSDGRVEYRGSAAAEQDHTSAGMRRPLFHDSAQGPRPKGFMRSFSDNGLEFRAPVFQDSAASSVPRHRVRLDQNSLSDDGSRDFGVPPSGANPPFAQGKEGRAGQPRPHRASVDGGRNPRFLQPADANAGHYRQGNSNSQGNSLRPTNIARHSANFGFAERKVAGNMDGSGEAPGRPQQAPRRFLGIRR